MVAAAVASISVFGVGVARLVAELLVAADAHWLPGVLDALVVEAFGGSVTQPTGDMRRRSRVRFPFLHAISEKPDDSAVPMRQTGFGALLNRHDVTIMGRRPMMAEPATAGLGSGKAVSCV
jgi:hypothetical protein